MQFTFFIFCFITLSSNLLSQNHQQLDDRLITVSYLLTAPAAIAERVSPAEYRKMEWQSVKYPDSTVDKRYVTYEKYVLVKPAVKYYETALPVFETVVDTFLVERPKKKRRKYKKITEQVLIKPAHEIYIIVPPKFKPTYRTRLTKEASDGIPEEHEDYHFLEVSQKASFEKKIIPAEYLKVEHWVKK